MSKEDFIDILSEMDKVGYYSVECWGGATFDSCIRYLDEDPWERLRLIRKMMPNTKLQMLLRGQNLLGYNHYPTEIVRDFIECAIKTGIDIIMHYAHWFGTCSLCKGRGLYSCSYTSVGFC